MQRIVEFEAVDFRHFDQIDGNLLHQSSIYERESGIRSRIHKSRSIGRTYVVNPSVKSRNSILQAIPIMKAITPPCPLHNSHLREIHHLFFDVELHKAILALPRIRDATQLLLV